MSDVEFPYRFEAEGRETTWYWFLDAAILETTRYDNCKVTDDDTGKVWTERKNGKYIVTYSDARKAEAQ